MKNKVTMMLVLSLLTGCVYGSERATPESIFLKAYQESIACTEKARELGNAWKELVAEVDNRNIFERFFDRIDYTMTYPSDSDEKGIQYGYSKELKIAEEAFAAQLAKCEWKLRLVPPVPSSFRSSSHDDAA